MGLVALNIGGPIGVYVFGMINDRYGRRFSYFSCLGTLLIGSFITAFSTNFGMWAFSRIIVGLTIPAVYQIPFIIGMYFLISLNNIPIHIKDNIKYVTEYFNNN